MAAPPPKKFKGTEENDDGNDSFDDDEILDDDGPSERYNQFMSQRTQYDRVTKMDESSSSRVSSHSTPPTVTHVPRSTTTPGQGTLKTTPTSSRLRPSAFSSSSRNSANTPTSFQGSQNTVSEGEFIAVKYQLTNAQREKEDLKYKLAKANEELMAEKKRMEVEKHREIRKYQEKLKMTEGEVRALQIANTSMKADISMRADTSMMSDDLNQSVMSVSSVGYSQRVNTARHTHSVPQFSAGNGFRSDIAATFTHNQTIKKEGETSFEDVPSQAFDTPSRVDLTPILNRIPSPVQPKVEIEDVKLQTDLNNEVVLEVPHFCEYILSTLSTVASSGHKDDELYTLVENIVKDPTEEDVVQIGQSDISPVSSQEDIDL